MSIEVTFRIKGRLTPLAARVLKSFISDWEGEEDLPSDPKDRTYKYIYDNMQRFFDEVTDEMIYDIEDQKLDLKSHFKVGDLDMDFIIKEVFPQLLVSMEEGWCQYHDFGTETHFKFDQTTKKMKLSEKKSDPKEDDEFYDEEEESLDMERDEATAEWEEVYAQLKPKEWRKKLATLLILVADVELQEEIYVKKTKKSPIPGDVLFDLTSFYFLVLNLEYGFYHAMMKDFLSSSEVDLLTPFHNKLKSYSPQDVNNNKKALKDPEWIDVCNCAQGLLKTLVPKLEK